MPVALVFICIYVYCLYLSKCYSKRVLLNYLRGPSIKDVRTLGVRGVRQKWTNADRGKGGG